MMNNIIRVKTKHFWLSAIAIFGAMMLFVGCHTDNPGMPVYKGPNQPIDKRVDDLLSRMTLEEKLGQLNMPVNNRLDGNPDDGKEDIELARQNAKKFAAGTYIKGIGPGGGFFTPSGYFDTTAQQAAFHNELQKIAVEETRLGIPLMMIEEGTHGLMASGATIFPEGPAIGSSWNLELVKKIYAATAKETRAIGSHQICTIVIELLRDPRLGRNMEGYTEDPYLGSAIAESIVKGSQGENIAENDKAVVVLSHFPGQGESLAGLERYPMEVSERALRSLYLPPWVAGIKKAGALGVMPMHPAMDGVSTHASKKLLTALLREELGFQGIAVSEGRGILTIKREKVVSSLKEAGAMAIEAGVDVSISSYDEYLGLMKENVQEGIVSEETIDTAVRRILRLKFLMGLFESPFIDVEKAVQIVRNEGHQQLALEAAREGIVLLKNEKNLLPLSREIKSIAVIGPNAHHELNLLGDYFKKPVTQDVVTILEGIKSKVSEDAKISYVKGCNVVGSDLNEISKAAAAAKAADIAIVAVGENERYAPEGMGTNGEGCDISDLDLTGRQEELVQAVYATGTPTIVVLINGRPLSIRWIAENVPAIVEAWIPGEKGGTAVADVLFGDYNPSGRLPVTFPRHVGQIPIHYNSKPPSTFGRNYVNMPSTPLYEFGFGLSNTDFEYGNLEISPLEGNTSGEFTIKADVKNIGSRKGVEVVQLYIDDVVSSVVTPVMELKGFKKIELEPGQKTTVSFSLGPEELMLLDENLKPKVEPGAFEVMIGRSSADIRLKGTFMVTE